MSDENNHGAESAHSNPAAAFVITTCPYCMVTGPAKRPTPHPDLGAIMCDSCGEWVTWDEEAEKLGKPTGDHLAKLADSERGKHVRRVWGERKHAHATAGSVHLEGMFKVFWVESFVDAPPPIEDDDGFQMRLAFNSGVMALTELLGAPDIGQVEKAGMIMEIRAELGAFFDYADRRQPNDEAH